MLKKQIINKDVINIIKGDGVMSVSLNLNYKRYYAAEVKSRPLKFKKYVVSNYR